MLFPLMLVMAMHDMVRAHETFSTGRYWSTALNVFLCVGWCYLFAYAVKR